MSRARRHLAPARKHALERGRVLFNSHASPTCPYEVLPLLRDSAALRNQNGLSACKCCNVRVAWRTTEGVPPSFRRGRLEIPRRSALLSKSKDPTLTGERGRREGGKHGQRRIHEDIALPDLKEKVAPKRCS